MDSDVAPLWLAGADADTFGPRPRFDVEHLGAKVSQDPGAERPRHDMREVENPYAMEWRSHGIMLDRGTSNNAHLYAL